MTICMKRKALSILIAFAFCMLSGCQDGPLYALKAVNPWFALREWPADEAFGVTDHQRRKELSQLAETIDRMPLDRQLYWANHLNQIIENDQSSEMRRLAVLASGRIPSNSAMPLIQKGLDDENTKVRMEACRALSRFDDEQSVRLLATTVGKESNQDVRNAAIRSLAEHQNPISVNSLQLALTDRNPATRDLTMQSLRSATGKNLGDDPDAWIAELATERPGNEQNTGSTMR